MKTKQTFLLIALLLTACIQLNAATFTVTNNANSGPGSLRDAINSANGIAGADVIVFHPDSFATPQTIVLSSYLPITTDITITGPGADMLCIDGNNATNLFQDNNGLNTVVISGLEMKQGIKSAYGGAIFIPEGHLTVRYCNIHNCAVTPGSYGGAIAAWNANTTITIENSTIHHNHSTGYAAGVSIFDGGTLTINNSTLYDNSSGGFAYGKAITSFDNSNVYLNNVTIAGHTNGISAIVVWDGGTLTARNCIFDNPINNTHTTPVTSLGHNISNNNMGLSGTGDMNNTSALLDPAGLQNNGGTTPTVNLQCNSPAQGATSNYFSIDQVGNARGSVADIGAFESSGGASPVPTISAATTFCAGSSTTLDAGIWSSYLWSTGATTQTISASTAGTYSVTVTNANGCTGSDSHTLTFSESPSPIITGAEILCGGSSTTLDAGSWSSYFWSTGATTQTISVNTAGPYSVTVTNADGCSGTTTRTLGTVPTVLTVNAGGDETTYFGFSADQSLSRTATAGGGVPPYAFAWKMNRALKCNMINTSGDEVFSSGGCTYNSCPSSPLNTVLSSPPACSGSATVSVKLIEDAVLTVTVTDANNCSASSSFTLYSEDARCFSGNSNIEKVIICHHYGNRTSTMCVNEDAVADHLSHGDNVGSCTGNRQEEIAGESSSVFTAYPNPFTGRTTIAFSIPVDGNAAVKVFDAMGRQVTVLFDGMTKAGELNKVEFNGDNYAPGIYFYSITSAEMNEMQRMELIK
jgi:hypothetical protein